MCSVCVAFQGTQKNSPSSLLFTTAFHLPPPAMVGLDNLGPTPSHVDAQDHRGKPGRAIYVAVAARQGRRILEATVAKVGAHFLDLLGGRVDAEHP
mmetsp:Transcript_131031/g.407515  ORF Transcript_131031/g.407515 Transcript_131031/m.407515 type:complete len:96 (-) Transcript_131031:208-495(-)